MEYPNKATGNNVGETVSAYAKVAGRDWTYYVNEMTINIGRPPDGPSRQSMELGSLSSPAQQAEDAMNVQIDLGPSKLVSRLHAELFFDQKDGKWHVLVNGRNGVRINETTLRRGQRLQLTSGDVIEIAGTEMMFVTAEHPALIHQKYRDRLNAPSVKEVDPETFSSQAHAHPESTSHTEEIPSSQQLPVARIFNNGQTVIAPTPSDFARPSTPVRSPTRAAQAANVATKSPAYGRAIMMQSSEQINYASDAVKDIKPACSYAVLIGQAILSTSEEMLTLAGIYEWIKENFSYYRHNPNSGWQV